jgi:predicted DCC family thiol-disulfide oxidoreductase YuxK
MAVVLFDGVCNLCNALVRFVIARDPDGHFQFAALTSDAARRLLQAAAVPSPLPDSVVLVDEGRVFTRSDAALRIARRLQFPWRLAYGLTIVPKGLRDRLYDVVARRRYHWFGRRDTCLIPSPAIRRRFLDQT